MEAEVRGGALLEPVAHTAGDGSEERMDLEMGEAPADPAMGEDVTDLVDASEGEAKPESLAAAFGRERTKPWMWIRGKFPQKLSLLLPSLLVTLLE